MQLPQSVTRFMGRASLTLKKHAPDILMGVGIAGVVGTIYLSNKAGREHESVRRVNEAVIETGMEALTSDFNAGTLQEKEYKQEVGKLHIFTWMSWAKLYGPTVALGTASVASIIFGHMKNKERLTSALAAYTMVDQAWKKYRGRVIEELGPEKDEEFRFGKPEKRDYEMIDETTGKKKKVRERMFNEAGDYARLFDEYSIEWRNGWEYNHFFLKSQQNYWNNVLQTRGHVFLNEVYISLGIAPTPEGQLVGWSKAIDGDNVIDFGLNAPMNEAFMKALDPVCIIDPNVEGEIYNYL